MSGVASMKRPKSTERCGAVPVVMAAVRDGVSVVVKKQRDFGGIVRSRLARSVYGVVRFWRKGREEGKGLPSPYLSSVRLM